MNALKRFRPALAGASIGLSLVSGQVHAADAVGRVGSFRSSLGELSQGLSISLAQGVRYDSNIVRTSGDAETLALYGTDDASDTVSQTSLNVTYSAAGRRSQLKFGGDLSYAKYFDFDEFSGLVAGGNGSFSWNFSDRCALDVGARIERRIIDLSNAAVPNEGFQLEYASNGNIGCFIMERIRVSAGIFGDQVNNQESVLEFADVDYWGYQGTLAYVTAQKNEVGVRYRRSTTQRPNDPNPLVQDVDNERIEGYTQFQLGNRLKVGLSAGSERVMRDLSPDEDRGTATADLSWTFTERTKAHVYYTRASEDATDLSGTTSETDRFGGDVDWKLANGISVGAFAVYQDDTLDSGTGGFLNGVEEQVENAGVYLEHPLFHRVNVRWTAGYSNRDSDVPDREFNSFSAGVALGVGF